MLRPLLGPAVDAELSYRRTLALPTCAGARPRPAGAGLLRMFGRHGRPEASARSVRPARVTAGTPTCATS